MNIQTAEPLKPTMTHATTSPVSDYAAGYTDGRHAAKERVTANENPYKTGSQCWHGWNDGHYDERSSRFVQIERHSAQIWSREK